MIRLLEHLASRNPNLHNLVLRDCFGPIPVERLPDLLANITHLEVYMYKHTSRASVTFQSIIEKAPKLRSLVYDHPLDSHYGLPFSWFQNHINRYGTTLQTVQFRPMMPEDSHAPATALEWCKLQERTGHGYNSLANCEGIVDNVVHGRANDCLCIHAPMLLARIRSSR